MDLPSIIIGLICCALFVVPIIYIQSVQKNKSRKFLADFNNLAAEQQLIMSQHDLWKHCYAIGIDTKANKLFYLKKEADKNHTALVSLSDLAACSVGNINRNINNNKVIDRLELVLSFRNTKMPRQTLEFYNVEKGMALNDELRLVEKWNTILNSSIDAGKKPSLAV